MRNITGHVSWYAEPVYVLKCLNSVLKKYYPVANINYISKEGHYSVRAGNLLRF